MRIDMRGTPERSPRRRIWWGLVLITVGVLFMLDRYGIVEIGSVWRYWPALVIASGFSHLLFPDYGNRARGLFPIGIGLWLFACQFHWYGFSYANGWPVILVIAGLSMLVGNLTGSYDKHEEQHHV
jgi:hypothetical protein